MNNKPCPICELGEDVCSEVARLFAVGLPASDVVSYLATEGHRQTQRQLIAHRLHTIALKSPRMTGATGATCGQVSEADGQLATAGALELTGAAGAPESPDEPTDLQREDSLILGFLAATDRMLAALEQTGSIKISRAATELGALAHSMLRVRMERATPVDPVINIVIGRHRLEDTEAVREIYLDNLEQQATAGDNGRQRATEEDPEAIDEQTDDQITTLWGEK